jgi:hypothetical protein
MGGSTSALLSHVFLQNIECRSWGTEVATLCRKRIMTLRIMWHVVAQRDISVSRNSGRYV